MPVDGRRVLQGNVWEYISETHTDSQRDTYSGTKAHSPAHILINPHTGAFIYLHRWGHSFTVQKFTELISDKHTTISACAHTHTHTNTKSLWITLKLCSH